MRLIDADALGAEVKHWKRQQHSMNIDYSTGYRCALSVVEGIIADAPTIDAIPVEWLRKWTKDLREGAYVRDILRDWQEEQEAR